MKFISSLLIISSIIISANPIKFLIEPDLENLDGTKSEVKARYFEDNFTFDITDNEWRITLFNNFLDDNESFLEYETLNLTLPKVDLLPAYKGAEQVIEFHNGKKKTIDKVKHLVYEKLDPLSNYLKELKIDLYEYKGELKFDFSISKNSLNDLKFTLNKPAKINENGELEIIMSLGKIIFEKPISYNFDYADPDSLDFSDPASLFGLENPRKEIELEYYLDGNELSFKSNSELKGEMIHIDPVIRIESSYYGGLDDDRFYDSDRDAEGNYYLCGVTSSSGKIAFNGHQTIKNDFQDAFLVKITPSGNREWATYYGGDGTDIAYGVGVSNDGKITIVGETSSNDNISTSNSHQSSPGGGQSDGFIATFDSNGDLDWATYYGGSETDKLNDIALDEFGNVYVAGFSNSDDNISASGYQNNRNGDFDAIVAKFNPLGTRRWGTYYGGSEEDYGNSIDLDSEGNIYFSGSTESASGISLNGHQNNLGGNFDSYLVRFDPSGDLDWGTYFGGTDSDIGNHININGNKILLTGSTRSGGLAIGGNQTNLGGSFDGIYALFETDGTLDHSSYLGGAQNDDLRAGFLSEEAIYVTGFTRSNDNIAFNAFQEFREGAADAIFTKYTISGELEYSSYYGGTNSDFGRSIRLDSDTLFIAGYTNSINNISDNGYQNANSGLDDGFFVFFEDQELSVSNKIISNFSKTYCAEGIFTVDFEFEGDFPNPTNTRLLLSDNFGNFENAIELASGDFDPNIKNTISFEIPSDIQLGSSYKMKIVSNNPAVESNSTQDILIIPLPKLGNKLDQYCENRKFSLGAKTIPGMQYDWIFPDGSRQENVNTIEIFHEEPGEYEYTMIQKGHGCEESLDFTINVSKLPVITIDGPELLCRNTQGEYTVSSSEGIDGNTLLWRLSDVQLVSGELNKSKSIVVRAFGENPRVSCQVFGYAGGVCHPSKIFDINYYEEIEEILIQGSTSSCQNCTEIYTSNAGEGTYQWSVQGGEILGANNQSEVEVKWDELSEGRLFLNYTSQNGCSRNTEIQIYLSEEIFTSFFPNPLFVCEGEITTFSTSSATFLENSWEVEGGLILEDRGSAIDVYWSEEVIGKISLTQVNNNTSKTETVSHELEVGQKVDLNIIENSITECVGVENSIEFENIPNLEIKAQLEKGTILNISDTKVYFVFDEPGNAYIKITGANKNNCDTVLEFNYSVIDVAEKPKLSIENNVIKSNMPAIFLRNDKELNAEPKSEYYPQINGIYSAYSINENGCISEKSNSIFVSFNSVSNLPEEILVYPNPTDSELNIRLRGNANIKLIDANGKQYLSQSINGNSKIDISKYRSGFYILQFEINGELYREKIIIK